MNLYHLRYFQVLAEYEHYTKASKELNITQPSLSYAISSLEDQVGVTLFEKDGRNIVLTKAGKQFLEVVNKSLNKLDSGIKDMQMISSGDGIIELGFLRTLGVFTIPDLAYKFKKEYPNNNIDFNFHLGITKGLLEKLSNNEYDLVISSYSSSYIKQVEFVPLAEQEMVLAVHKDHPLAKYDVIDLNDTLEYDYIGFAESSGLASLIDSLFNEIGKHPNYLYKIEEDQVVAGFVAQNYGIAIMPKINALNELPIKSIKIKNIKEKRFFYLAYLKDRVHPPVIENFIEFVKKYSEENNFIAY